MQLWNEDTSPEAIQVSDNILDVLFETGCRCIPVDHAYALAEAVRRALPWIEDAPGMALHSVHVAGSQNGWERPGHGTDSLLLVSKRTKLTIRTPKSHLDRLLEELPGQTLDIGGHSLTVGKGKVRLLSKETTLFARYLAANALTPSHATDPEPSEDAFLEGAARALAAKGIRVRKALCGKSTPLATPDGPIPTRSLMVAGLTPEESIRLQQEGLGPHRLLGCGIFIPHKGIEPVKSG